MLVWFASVRLTVSLSVCSLCVLFQFDLGRPRPHLAFVALHGTVSTVSAAGLAVITSGDMEQLGCRYLLGHLGSGSSGESK